MRTILHILIIHAALLLTACGSAPKKDNKEIAEDINNKKLEKGQQGEFAQHLVELAACNKYILQVLDLTLEKSNDTSLVRLAKNMHKDHERMDSELAFLAEARGVVLPTTLESGKKKELNDLSDDADEVFDKKALEGLTSLHRDSQDHLAGLIKSTDDTSAISWARKQEVMFADHLRLIQSYRSRSGIPGK